jgi:flagellar biosynthetic protein FliP
MKKLTLLLIVLFGANLFAAPAPSSSLLSSLGLVTSSGKGGLALSAPMQIALGLTLLTLLPAALMCITPFLRIIVVLHFLRQALGTQTAPSNQVLVGLSLFLALLVMQPVINQAYTQGWEPMEKGEIGLDQMVDRASAPLKTFMLRFAREKDIALFLQVAKQPAPRTPADLNMTVLIPAYILSELKTAFQIGAVLSLPFMVMDLVAASVTISIGMMQLPPVMLSAPFKILLFVLIDGWNLVVGSLLKSFYT